MKVRLTSGVLQIKLYSIGSQSQLSPISRIRILRNGKLLGKYGLELNKAENVRSRSRAGIQTRPSWRIKRKLDSVFILQGFYRCIYLLVKITKNFCSMKWHSGKTQVTYPSLVNKRILQKLHLSCSKNYKFFHWWNRTFQKQYAWKK